MSATAPPTLSALLERLDRIETREADRDVELGQLAGSLGRTEKKAVSVCGAFGTRLDAHARLVELLTKRVDELYYDIEHEMRPRLDTLNDEIEEAKADAEDTGKHAREAIERQTAEMAKVERMAVVVGRLNRERKARAASERTALLYKRRARALFWTLVTSAAMVAGGTASALVLHRCGISSTLITHEVNP